MANDKSKLSVGKPKKIGGAIFRASATATVPTSATAELTGFTCLGYVSEDGVTNSNSKEVQTIKEWGGEIVATPVTGHTDTFQATLIEALNAEVLKVVHGDDNVEGSSLDSGIVVSVNADDDEEHIYVIDMALKGGVRKRIVIPCGMVTAVGDVVYKKDNLIGYPITITGEADSAGNTHYEYLKTVSGT